ncbi:MAG: DEAD/DEAH box helicase [Opitutales bacterium]
MATVENQTKGLAHFERLDVGELYYIANRQCLEQGLALYRNFAVEGLEWDPQQQQINAQVAGSGMRVYNVSIRLKGAHIEHRCDCQEWDASRACVHVIAATAAIFLAVQGKSPGGFEMPPDYAQDLRKLLGYKDVGDSLGVEEPCEDHSTELCLVEVCEYGVLDFQVEGALPVDFLREMGINVSGDYGFSVAKEFTLNAGTVDFADFILNAEARGIRLKVQIEGEILALKYRKTTCGVQFVYDFSEDSVWRSIAVLNSQSKALSCYALIERSPYVILVDGTVRKVKKVDGTVIGRMGPLEQATDPESFNEAAHQHLYQGAKSGKSMTCQYLIEGRNFEPLQLEKETVSLHLDLHAVENAAGEREGIEFDLFAKVRDLELDLLDFQSGLLSSLVDSSYGTLLSAKRRVRALMDLMRRLISAHQNGAQLEMDTVAAEFPEIVCDEFETVVRQIIQRVEEFTGGVRAEHPRLILDDQTSEWLVAQIPYNRVAMLLFSLFDAVTRDDLKCLVDGVVSLARQESSDAVLQRIVSVCAAMGVRVRFNDQAIRTAPLKINLKSHQGAGAQAIDWFELHPSITCADRSISPDEWKRLILGQVFLESEDGGLIMPQVGDGESDGLQMLAAVLQRKSFSSSDAASDTSAGLQISRLEMLDWIALRRRGVQLELPDAVEAVFSSLQSFESLKCFEPAATLKAELRPYQQQGCAWIEFLYHHRFGACLADDMGLGKTVQTLAFLANYFESQPSELSASASVLIVVPPSLVFNWMDEFERFLPSVKIVDCLSQKAWDAGLHQAQVLLTTYDRVRIDADSMRAHAFDIVVFDEAHNLKNVSTARTKAAAKLNRRFTLCLTGTPLENNVSEFYSVMHTTVPGIFGVLKDFKELYREDPERILRRSAPFILRRTKDKLLKELPKKEERELFLEMSAVQKEIYTRTIAEVREEVALAYEDRPEQQAGIVALAAILRLRQVCVSPELLGKPLEEPAPKFLYMADQLEELQAEGNAALVFSQFIGGLDQMELVAKARGISYLRMDGRTPVAQRKELVRAFQDEQGPSFFFISLKTGGVGLNLTRANYVFHLDPWWNPAVENQASDRAHRIGQKRSVYVQRLIMQHSIEARMLELKAQKAELFRQLVEEPGGKAVSGGFSKSDFDYLLNGE